MFGDDSSRFRRGLYAPDRDRVHTRLARWGVRIAAAVAVAILVSAAIFALAYAVGGPGATKDTGLGSVAPFHRSADWLRRLRHSHSRSLPGSSTSLGGCSAPVLTIPGATRFPGARRTVLVGVGTAARAIKDDAAIAPEMKLAGPLPRL